MRFHNKYFISFCAFLAACTVNNSSSNNDIDIFKRIKPMATECRKAVLIFNIIDVAYDDIEKNNSFTNTAVLHVCVADTFYQLEEADINIMIEKGKTYAYDKISNMYKLCNEKINSAGTSLKPVLEYSKKLDKLNEYTTRTLNQC